MQIQDNLELRLLSFQVHVHSFTSASVQLICFKLTVESQKGQHAKLQKDIVYWLRGLPTTIVRLLRN